jgi:predicted  nucleic acid-binding Zn-ribbon protein
MNEKSSEPRTIEQLKEEYDELNKRKIQTDTQLRLAEEQLAELRKAAIAEFETSDIEELEAKLKKMEQENERRRSEYQQLLDEISADLKKIDSEAGSGESSPEAAND